MVGEAGVTAIDARVAGVTVRLALPSIEPDVAEIVAEPRPVAEASPMLAPDMLTVAIVGSEVPHCTAVVTFRLEPSL
jgi:hypothetical protein